MINRTTYPRKTHERVAVACMSLGVPSIGIGTRLIGTPPKPYELLSIEAFDAWLTSCPEPYRCTPLYGEARGLVLAREMCQAVDNPKVRKNANAAN